MSELKYNTRIYKCKTAGISSNKNTIFEENAFILNTQTNDLYIGDGATKLSSLTAINNASNNLSDYAKKVDLEDYAKTEDIRPIIDFSKTDATISILGAIYIGDDGLYRGDGETAVKSLTLFISADE